MDSIDTAFDPGKKIVFSNPDAGYDHHRDTDAEHLVVGAVYTLIRQRMGSWHTDYWLAEVPGVAFNSVQFTEVPTEAGSESEGHGGPKAATSRPHPPPKPHESERWL